LSKEGTVEGCVEVKCPYSPEFNTFGCYTRQEVLLAKFRWPKIEKDTPMFLSISRCYGNLRHHG